MQEALRLLCADCQVRDLKRDKDAALKRRDAKEPANLRKVASQIVDRTKQDATALLAAGRKLLAPAANGPRAQVRLDKYD